MSEKGKNNKKKTGLGLAIWILAFLIILIVFLVKQEEIKSNFDKSGASELIEKKIGKEIFEKKEEKKSDEPSEIIIDLKKKPIKEEVAKKTDNKVVQLDTNEKIELKKAEEKKTEKKTEKKSSEDNQEKTKSQEAKKTVEPSKTQDTNSSSVKKNTLSDKVKSDNNTKTAQNTTQNVTSSTKINTKVCFVSIDRDGLVVRKEVSRNVEKDSPLLETINALLKGPSELEAKNGCKTYIPSGSKLLSLSISNGIANLNFNEDFQFNPNGSVGANVQLMQIVYTATSFSTVQKVQFLIEGQKKDYLTEGIWIGTPLSRSSF